MQTLSITPLGSGREVGRSCHLLTFGGLTILLDAGIHPGYAGSAGLPSFDSIDCATIDLVLVTHFHLDHAASLPYLTEKTAFKGRVFMTHPTKAVLRLLLLDYTRLMSMRPDQEAIYSEDDLRNCLRKVTLLDYHAVQELDLPHGHVKFWALNAGHVLGAAQFMISINGRNLLYTGDYSMEEDRHLAAAEVPEGKVDVLICESTYGVQVHPSRAEREARFTGTVSRVVTGGGRCLIPVFALGRAQELLLILDEFWRANPDLHSIPVYYASRLATKALRVYQTYVNAMNSRIRQAMDLGNPFAFKHIQNLKSVEVEDFEDDGPCVVFASPGMLQSGVSRKLFDRWVSNPKNGVIIAGYAVENTLAKDLAKEPEEVTTLDGRRQPLNMLVEYVSFSAHVDFVQNRDFISRVDPGRIILVHGQKHEMRRLKTALDAHFRKEGRQIRIDMPENGQQIRIPFAARADAAVMGTLADKAQGGGDLEGIMFTSNFQTRVVGEDDLEKYTSLRVGKVKAKLHVPYTGTKDTLLLFLSELFADCVETADGMTIGGLTVDLNQPRKAVLSWPAGPADDMIADATVAAIMHAQTSAASIRVTSKPCRHGIRDAGEGGGEERAAKIVKEEVEPNVARMKVVERALRDMFEEVKADYDGGKFEVVCEKANPKVPDPEEEQEGEGGNETTPQPTDVTCYVTLNFQDDGCEIRVECEEERQGMMVQDCLRQVAGAMQPVKV